MRPHPEQRKIGPSMHGSRSRGGGGQRRSGSRDRVEQRSHEVAALERYEDDREAQTLLRAER